MADRFGANLSSVYQGTSGGATPPVYSKLKLTLDASVWTPIVVPFDCNYINIRNIDINGVDILIRSDSTDSTTEDSIAAGSQETISAQFVPDANVFRFNRDTIVCYLKSSSGSVATVLTFVR
jgi:hypothetical protein